MPKNLTDVSQWATVAVPVGTDTADAASVETPFQILADRTRYLLGLLGLSTLLEADFSRVAAGWAGNFPRDICFASAYDAFHAIDADGDVVYSIDPWQPGTPVEGGLGVMWEDETGTLPSGTWAANGSRVQICADGAGTRLAVSNSAVTQVQRSILLGTWAAVTPATAGILWTACCHGGGLFAIGGSTGNIETSPTGSTWTARTSGISDYINCIEHNQESGGDARFVCLSNANVTYSSDGITWTNAAHGLTSSPLRLAYSALGQRWIALLQNGDIAYSDDQGVNWTQVAAPLPLWNTTWPSGAGLGIASNGQGAWYALNASGGQHSIWASVDNGGTWKKVYPVKANSTIAAGVAYGNGCFCTVGEDGALFTPRALEV